METLELLLVGIQILPRKFAKYVTHILILWEKQYLLNIELIEYWISDRQLGYVTTLLVGS